MWQDREVDGETTTPLTLLKRLNAYKKQCESNGEYVEAQKARKKYEELRAKELKGETGMSTKSGQRTYESWRDFYQFNMT